MRRTAPRGAVWSVGTCGVLRRFCRNMTQYAARRRTTKSQRDSANRVRVDKFTYALTVFALKLSKRSVRLGVLDTL